ncbi:tetratricopeptide repeat-containing sensor histidine kinase [Tenacibaculum amylolyticum]|uniref:tetratricopeptide repeat-containing sensor histidine kinase n=1 Tax=Tenacibaculum amylolyticum TaxID=104269 RepID=UPI003894245E
MHQKHILSFLFIFLFFHRSIVSQEKSPFQKAIEEKSNKYDKNSEFKKIKTFFFEKQWDSTLVNTAKQLKKQNLGELKNYYHLFRGESFRKKGVYNEAKRELSFITKDFVFHPHANMYIGTCEMQQRNYKQAITYLQQIENIQEKDLLGIKKTSVLQNIGLCYLLLTKYNEAEPYLIKTLKIQEKVKDTSKLIIGYMNLANLYYRQDKKELGIDFFKKAYDLSKHTNDFRTKRNTAFNMSAIEERRNNLAAALKYIKEYKKWNDSLNNQNRIYEVAQKEKEFAVKEKQQEVDLLQVENELKETQRNIFLYSAIGLLLFLGIGAYFFREKVKTNKIIAKQKETLDELNATKDKLFSIVSHDLRSSVNALKSSNTVLLDNLQSKNINALEHLLQKNSGIVNGAYGLLDNLLNWALLQTNGGYFHIENHRLFILVEHVSYNYKALLLEKAIHFENNVSKKAIVAIDQESLKIVLRNLLDNAIKFSKPEGSITIHTQESDSYWDLVVEDTGLGMSEDTRLELLKDSALLHKKEHEDVLGTGLGLSLVKSMIQKNNGKFSIESELGKGTKMIVSLPKTPLNG